MPRCMAAVPAFRAVPPPNDAVFTAHMLFVCALLACIPFSKLMHLGGLFFSPTFNQANNPRERRHVNPWNHAASKA